MDESKSDARRICEEHLQEQIRYNLEHKILPSENSVAERMLASGNALQRFYGEIYPALSHDGITWKHALHCALYVGTFWTPEDIAERRAGRKELEQLNEEISQRATHLSELLDRRTRLYEQSGFGAETHYAIYDVIDAASERNGHYQNYLKEPLKRLHRFDLKYWPSLADCIRVIGTDAWQAELAPDNSLTAAATRSSRPSKADSVRALLASVEDHRGDWLGGIPTSFEFSNGALADLVNVLFELPVDDLVSDEYMKTERHRAAGGARRRA
jgi:hypothetical protein